MANERARQLRRSLTPQEVKLWVHLRQWRDRGYHFRRQRPHGSYVVDFVCLKHHLVIEIDGVGELDEVTDRITAALDALTPA